MILRRFVPSWFDDYSTWLEYSISKDAAFCLCCYLYKSKIGEKSSGDSFTIDGFTNWKKKERFDSHVGKHNSAYNLAWKKCQDLMNQERHIEVAFETHSTQARKEYRMRLTATIDCIRFLLHQGLAFRGNDESSDSVNQGNFLQLLKFLSEHNETINKVVLENAPGNSKLIAPQIQHDIVHVASGETTKAIINDLNDEFLSILIYESRDIAVKEQMAILLRYVNLKGCVIERFLGIVHISDTTSLSLKLAMEGLFSKYGLSISSLRGQGYDGASNMRGEFNGLKALILKENPSAYYVHYFAHQLQLALVAVAKNHSRVAFVV